MVLRKLNQITMIMNKSIDYVTYWGISPDLAKRFSMEKIPRFSAKFLDKKQIFRPNCSNFIKDVKC